jgi:ribosomal protein S18 acetylase RimI-like enzyme
MPASSPVIRSATPDDYESIAQLLFRNHTISFAPYATDEWVTSRRLDEYRTRWHNILSNSTSEDATIVASIDGEVVGSVHVSPAESPEYDAQLIGMHVEPHLTGAGIGGLLMRSALEFIGEQGFARVELGVIAANSGARRFYEAYGWVLVRTFPKGIEGVPVAVYKLS